VSKPGWLVVTFAPAGCALLLGVMSWAGADKVTMTVGLLGLALAFVAAPLSSYRAGYRHGRGAAEEMP
jgi:hypothetical protein